MGRINFCSFFFFGAEITLRRNVRAEVYLRRVESRQNVRAEMDGPQIYMVQRRLQAVIKSNKKEDTAPLVWTVDAAHAKLRPCPALIICLSVRRKAPRTRYLRLRISLKRVVFLPYMTSLSISECCNKSSSI